jgi:hypothetical protein
VRTLYALFWGEQQASAAFVALACNFFDLRGGNLPVITRQIAYGRFSGEIPSVDCTTAPDADSGG